MNSDAAESEMESWIDGALLGFDTETTGTDVAADRIVTAALVYSVPGASEIVSTWLIDPGVPIPEGAAAVHGISTDYAREHGSAPAEALDEVAALLSESLQLDIPIVAFNAGFDLAILEADLARNGLPTLTERLGGPIAPLVDPFVIDRAVDRYRRGKRTLTAVSEVYGIAQDGRMHTADVDVSVTLQVLRAIAAKHPKIGSMSLAELYTWQVDRHREWAENFNDYLRGKGRPADVNPRWPS